MALPHVQPGELITAAAFNRVIDAINAVADRPDPIDSHLDTGPYVVALDDRKRRSFREAIIATGKDEVEPMRKVVARMIEQGVTPLEVLTVLDEAGVAPELIVEVMQAVADIR